MTYSSLLDTIPRQGITKREWRERVDRTGRNYTDPVIYAHANVSEDLMGDSVDTTLYTIVAYNEDHKETA